MAALTVFVIISLGLLALGVYVIVDIAGLPSWAFDRVGTTKTLWLVMSILFLFVCGLAALVVDIIWLTSKREQVKAAAASGGPGYSAGPPPGWGTPPATAAPPMPPPPPPATAAPPPAPPSDPLPPAQ